MNRKGRRSQQKKTKKIPVVTAQSSNTGIVHFFGNPKEWTNTIKNFEDKYLSKQKSDLITALSFDSFLQSKKIQTIPDYVISGSVFRSVAPAFDVWSVAGSLADGGRFNIGGAQQIPELPNIRKFSSLYVASSLECTLAETAKPHGKIKCYKMTLKKEMTLWDLNKVITELDHPSLKEIINLIPVDAIWGYQKIPMVSQILAAFLKSKGGNGIIYPSVKMPSEQNISLFFSSDGDAKASFEVEEVIPRESI